MSGFVVIRREALDHHVIGGNPAHFRAWCWLIASACWKPTKFNVAGTSVTLERGQICASIRHLADAWGMSKSAVDRFLTRLETETMIVRNSGHGRLILTICNYSKYQDKPSDDRDSSGTATGTAAGQQRDTKEQGNKGTIEEEEAKASPSSARTGSKPDPFPRPEWAEPQAWGDFLVNRKGGKGRRSYPNTATAYAKFLSDIARLSDDEWPPGRLLKHAAAKGWAGIYDPRENQNGRSQKLQLADRSTAGAATGALARIHAAGAG